MLSESEKEVGTESEKRPITTSSESSCQNKSKQTVEDLTSGTEKKINVDNSESEHLKKRKAVHENDENDIKKTCVRTEEGKEKESSNITREAALNNKKLRNPFAADKSERDDASDEGEKTLVIDDVDVAKQIECVNPHCTSGSGLTQAPVFVLTYFGIRRAKNVVQRVCDVCYQMAEDHFVKLSQMARKKEPIYNANFPDIKDDVVVMDKVDEIYDEPVLSENNIDLVYNELIDVMEKVWYDLDGNFQLAQNEKILRVQMKELEEKVKEMNENLKMLDCNVEEFNERVYKNKHVIQPKLRFLPDHDIAFDKSQRYYPLLPLSQCQLPSHLSSNEPAYSPMLPPAQIVPSEAKDIVALAEIAVDKCLPPGEVKYPPLKANDPVFIMKFNAFGMWFRGKVIEVEFVRPYLKALYKVSFDNANNKGVRFKKVPGRHLAYTIPSTTSYPVFTRVIALYVDSNDPSRNGYYVGIIAEPQKHLNRFRYLIFFDNGSVQYIDHNHIFPVCQPPENIWEDVDDSSRAFIKRYKEQYPERPMVRLQKGMTVRTEFESKWFPATVVEVDASLVKVSFDGLNRVEWIYRGSTRLRPLYDKVIALRQKRHYRGVGPSTLRMRNMPYIEYRREDEVQSDSSGANSRNVAKKSTAGKILLNMPPSNLAGRQYAFDFPTKGYIRQMQLVGRLPSKPFESHDCQESCIDWTNYKDIPNRKKLPPLIIPLMVAFTRLTMKGKGKRGIVYTTPCGRNVRNYEELRKYLKITKCSLGIDLFDFDPWVRVTDEFYLESNMLKTYIEDISDGVENVAIACVNEIYDAWPLFPQYSTQRLPQHGVNLNCDPDYMVCCDCTDDCADKVKCACWLLTMEGVQVVNKGEGLNTNVGYQNRRLPEAITTGIYECHSRCKCSKETCLNRVAQHPLQQRLQVFRTLHKGWGLRTLNDIPAGAFICIYVGRLLTEASANEDGRVFGDEYLAELDYIEVVEQLKEGFEEEAIEPSEKSDESDKEENEEPDDFLTFIKEKDKSYKPGGAVFDKTQRRTSSRISSKLGQKAKEQKPAVATCITISDDDNDHDENSSPKPRPTGDGGANKKPSRKSVREWLGDHVEECYIMDAKSEGNIGRYLNHSCQPNVFVQNVFVDTHDLRFPWIAFFALNHIKAGSELTWDYNYDIGSVPQKVLYCYCGTPDCRGRLL